MCTKMRVKTLVFLIAVMVLITACSTQYKTIPIVGDVVGNLGQEETVSLEEIDENETRSEEDINETEEDINETEEETPISANIITIKDLKLEPQEITIKKGDTVVWKHVDEWENDGVTRHYIAAHNNEFRSPVFYYGDTFKHTFNKTGTFTYIDILYKGRSQMKGKIIVE